MKIDLDRALAQIAGTAEVAARPVPIDRLLGRVHRRRTARTVTHGVVGVGATAAVAFGGMQLAETGPQNARGTAPVVSETPTVPPAAEALPKCNDPVPALENSGPDDLRAQVWFGPDRVSAPDPTDPSKRVLFVMTSYYPELTDVIELHDDFMIYVELAVVHDGVVVSPWVEPESALLTNPEIHLTTVPLVTCPVSDVGVPLPAGSYELQAVVRVTQADEDPVVLVGTAPFAITPSGEVVVDEAHRQRPEHQTAD